jgi:hypothetical protein
MVLNIVYTLFFATAIVCAARGLGWWGVHLYQKRKKQAAAMREKAVAAGGASLPAAA